MRFLPLLALSTCCLALPQKTQRKFSVSSRNHHPHSQRTRSFIDEDSHYVGHRDAHNQATSEVSSHHAASSFRQEHVADDDDKSKSSALSIGRLDAQLSLESPHLRSHSELSKTKSMATHLGEQEHYHSKKSGDGPRNAEVNEEPVANRSPHSSTVKDERNSLAHLYEKTYRAVEDARSKDFVTQLETQRPLATE